MTEEKPRIEDELPDEEINLTPKMSTGLKVLILLVCLVVGIGIGKIFAEPYGPAPQSPITDSRLMYIHPFGCDGPNTTCAELETQTRTFANDLGLTFHKVWMNDPSIYPALFALSEKDMSPISVVQTKENIGIFLCDNVGGTKACNLVGPPKSDKPKVWLFAMSHCPYGVQMEKAMIPVIDAFGEEIDFELKFVDYVMHGDKEIVEQMVQVCIQEHYPEELTTYLKCFTNNPNTKYCTSGRDAITPGQEPAAKVNQTVIESCFMQLEDRLHIRLNARNESTYKGRYPVFPINAFEADKYGVKGSPTLIVNGKKATVTRSPEAIKDVICEAFNTAPDTCDVALDDTPATPGFGNKEAGASADGGCGA